MSRMHWLRFVKTTFKFIHFTFILYFHVFDVVSAIVVASPWMRAYLDVCLESRLTPLCAIGWGLLTAQRLTPRNVPDKVQ